MATAKKGKKFVLTVKVAMSREMTRSEARAITQIMLGYGRGKTLTGRTVTGATVSRDVQIE